MIVQCHQLNRLDHVGDNIYLIVDKSLVKLYYLDYLYIDLDLDVFIEALKCNKNIYIDFTTHETRVAYPKGRHNTFSQFVITTEESFTDNGENDTMTYFYVPIPSLTDLICQ